jgi:hypothetical protein
MMIDIAEQEYKIDIQKTLPEQSTKTKEQQNNSVRLLFVRDRQTGLLSKN